jgi:hypothetical protein
LSLEVRNCQDCTVLGSIQLSNKGLDLLSEALDGTSDLQKRIAINGDPLPNEDSFIPYPKRPGLTFEIEFLSLGPRLVGEPALDHGVGCKEDCHGAHFGTWTVIRPGSA